MSPTFLKRAGLVLAAVLVAWGLFAMFRGGVGETLEGLTLPKVDPTTVNQITIEGPVDTVVLIRTGGTDWEANGLPASSPAVNDLYNGIADSSVTSELAARSAASHQRMGVDSAGATRVRFMAGADTLADLLVGNKSPSGLGVFVRLLGQDEVFVVRGPLGNLVGKQPDDWRDKAIVSVNADSVTGVTVDWPGRRYTVTRTDTTWSIDGAAADARAVDLLVRGYGNLLAAGFPTAEEAAAIDFATPYGRVTLTTGGGSTLASLVFDSTDTGLWVQRQDGKITYRLNPWRSKTLAPEVESLRQ